jgi:molybdenum cofactor cytidylyltransferase
MPRIAPGTIKAVVDALRQGALVAAPVYKGERGHPVGFGAALRDELLKLDGDQGARAVLERHRDSVRLVECDDPGILFDVDRKSDIAR